LRLKPPSSGSNILPFSTAALAIGIFIADTLSEAEIAVSVLFVAVVLLSSRLYSDRGVLIVGLGCMGLTVLSLFFSRSDPWRASALSNALLSLVAIGATTLLVMKMKQAEERLRQSQADLAHVNRVTTMGEMTASLAHEVNQPIAGSVTNADACLRWLAADPPNLDEARAAAMNVVKDGRRAAEIISHIRLLFKKATPQRGLVDLNEVIREMIVLLHGEITRCSIVVSTELAGDLPRVTGDRVQLQQVMMNLITNSIAAMKDVNGRRELAIKSRRAEDGQITVCVSDSGMGLPPQQADQIFNAFFTTKRDGTGMGLPISRSIVESHNGRLWAADNTPRGASFHLVLPIKGEAHE
jgi:C4-dicarboxylate-specific signal transduction histidine kinase